MVLMIFLAWIALGALAVLFVYCCSRVSNGPRDLADDDWTSPLAEPVDTARSTEFGVGRSYDFDVLSDPSAERRPHFQ
jgi:hypothetical protein